jgi:hypothetical protein
MSAERPSPMPETEQGDGVGPPGALVEREAQERADSAEDRRRQQDLDYGELGGEA